jgi:hypothetical protein
MSADDRTTSGRSPGPPDPRDVHRSPGGGSTTGAYAAPDPLGRPIVLPVGPPLTIVTWLPNTARAAVRADLSRGAADRYGGTTIQGRGDGVVRRSQHEVSRCAQPTWRGLAPVRGGSIAGPWDAGHAPRGQDPRPGRTASVPEPGAARGRARPAVPAGRSRGGAAGRAAGSASSCPKRSRQRSRSSGMERSRLRVVEVTLSELATWPGVERLRRSPRCAERLASRIVVRDTLHQQQRRA